MTRFFKTLGLLVAVACFVWVGVLWRWQATQRDMSERDIAVYLGALPLTVFALVLLARWAWQGGSASAPAGELAVDPAAAVPDARPASDAAERQASLQLLASHLHCAAGKTPAAVCAALEEGKPRPDLDPDLRDDDGLPLLTARIRDLEPEELQLEVLEAALQAEQPAMAQHTLRAEVRRALAALQAPLDACLGALRPWRARLGLDDKLPDQVSTSTLRLVMLWPPQWNAYEAAVARRWLLSVVCEAAVVTPARLYEAAPPGEGGWLEIERLAHGLEREGRADLVLVTACHSAIGPDSVRRLQSEGRLFTSRTARSPIAGEAAAALVLAPSSWPADADAESAPVRLHRAAVVLRDKPIDASGRTTAAAAEHCVEQAQATGPFVPANLAAAVHDADQHTPRASEALTTLLGRLPHLQPDADVLQSGALNGQTGIVAPLIVTALAAHRAQALGQPCLALSVDDARLRLALVVRPASFDPSAGNAVPAVAAA